MVRIVISAVIVCSSIMLTILSGCDDGGGKTTILPISQGSSGTMLVLFGTSSTYSGGDFGARAGADATCKAEAPTGVTNVHAFISIAPVAIADMPEKYGYSTSLPIYGQGGTSAERIADDWQDLLDGDIDISLDTAGVFATTGITWWSNSNADGTQDTLYNGCNDFISNAGTDSAMAGYSSSFTTNWMEDDPAACDTSRYILCIGVK